ncbi:SIALI-17 repeat-containing surface protein [Streptococcus panodentis]
MKRSEKVLRYSIRKSLLGVGSVVICALALFWGHGSAAADEAVAAAEPAVLEAVQPPADSPAAAEDLNQLKDSANEEVSASLAEKLADLEENVNLSDEEKHFAGEEARKTVEDAKKVIEAAESQDRIHQGKEGGLTGIAGINPVGQDLFLDEIEDEKEDFEELLSGSEALSEADKAAFREGLAAEAARAAAAIQKLAANAATAAEAEAIQSKVAAEANHFLKFAAASELDLTLAAKLADLKENPNLSEAEQQYFKAEAEKAAGLAKREIEDAEDSEVFDQAKAVGLAAIAAIHPVGKELILEEIEEDRTEIFKAIESSDSLSAEGRAAAEKQVGDAAKRAQEAVLAYDEQADNAAAAEKIQEQIAAEELGFLKVLAAVRVDLAAADKAADLKTNPNLSEAELDEAQEKIEAAAAAAKEVIEQSASLSEAEQNQASGIAVFDTIHPVGKELILEEIEEEADKQFQAIEKSQSLSSADKRKAQNKIVEALKAAHEAVNLMASNADSAAAAEKIQEQIADEETKAFEILEAIVEAAEKNTESSSIPSDAPQADALPEFQGGVSDSEPVTAESESYDLTGIPPVVSQLPSDAPQADALPEFQGGVSDSDPVTAELPEFILTAVQSPTAQLPSDAPQADALPEFQGGVSDSEPVTAELPEFILTAVQSPTAQLPSDAPQADALPEFQGGVSDSDPVTADSESYDLTGIPPLVSQLPSDAPQVDALPEFQGGVSDSEPVTAELPEFILTAVQSPTAQLPSDAPQTDALPEFQGGVSDSDSVTAEALPVYHLAAENVSIVSQSNQKPQSALAATATEESGRIEKQTSSAAVLPRTGELSQLPLAALAAVSALSGLALLARNKKDVG